jgi:hypothetical protein
MHNFKKYDFVNFYVDDKLDRITYVSDVDESGRICVNGCWYDATYTKCIQVERFMQFEHGTWMISRTVNHMITRCTRDDIDKALENKRIDIERYQECIKLRREHEIMPTNYND